METPKEDWVKGRGEASPYDGNLLYWTKRLTEHPLMNNEKAKLLKIQQWQCPKCGLYFKEGDLLEVAHRVPTALGGGDEISNKWVFHRHCHDEKTAEDMARIAKVKAAGINHNGPYTEEPGCGENRTSGSGVAVGKATSSPTIRTTSMATQQRLPKVPLAMLMLV